MSLSQQSLREERKIGETKESFKVKKQWPKDWKEVVEREFDPEAQIERLTQEEKAVKKPNKDDLTKSIKDTQEFINEKQKSLKNFQDQIKDYMFSDPEF